MERYKQDIHVSSFANLRVSVYVVGYKNLGESIIVLFRDNKPESSRVLFSIVIDSYKKEQLFITKKILDDNEVTAVDMVYWTHPHKDHTPGLFDIVSGYYKPGMVFFLPKFYFGNLQKDLLKSESEYTEDTNTQLDSFLKSKGNYSNRRTIIGEGDMTAHYPIRMVTDDGLSKDLIFYFLTPIGRLIDKYSIPGNELSRPNDLSISFVMSIDGYDFYFGGDAERDHSEGIELRNIQDFRWIKVPHHCSKGGEYISGNLGPRFDFAASTVYTSSGLPEEDIQKQYASKGRLFMTQLKNENLEFEYGVVEFDYCFSDEEIIVDIHTYGNAREYVYNKDIAV